METNKYSRGKIYRIYAGDKEYIGSTIQSLSDRMSGHKELNRRLVSKKLFEEYGIENCRIELIEEYPCNSREELLWRERHYIETRNCINKQLPIRTEEERVEQERERKRQYHITHREQERKSYYRKHHGLGLFVMGY